MARPALERIGRIADGWITSSRTDLSRVGSLIAVVKQAAGEAGRDPEALRVICRGVVRAGEPVTGPDGERLLLSGSFDQIRADSETLAAAGRHRGVLRPQLGSADRVAGRLAGGRYRACARDPERARARLGQLTRPGRLCSRGCQRD